MAASTELRVVFDTNILFSAAGWRGNPYRCVDLARTGQIQAIGCTHIINELSEKLEIRLALPPERIDEIVADYLRFQLIVEIPGVLQAVPRDPEDNAILECAVAGRAEFIVTGDQDLLSL